ncbi:4-alpha-glucanotransferase (amylomaltase) [Myxococcus hansupus]|uniref:4-alpha-glucanotransferase n=1 Tax=Pseudomyxococcus hansupus TaxID=1297742 RepID=A0A0H4X1Q7_9BACT|nr:4-alpha-glucanotransferase [Myxococcus hansupus]AKQ69586.1 4-alpha-glucanotransferase (amylomaltase) [Myxococcus hansupus]
MSRALLPENHHRLVTEALGALDVRNLVLSIHDPSFPSLPEEDTGWGSPYSEGAADFLAFSRALGFNGIQLGPQGQVTEYNASPYDGTLFSRNLLNVALAALESPEPWGALLPPGRVAGLAASRPASLSPGARFRHAFREQTTLLNEAWQTFRQKRTEPDASAAIKSLASRFDTFRQQHRAWLVRDALFDVLCEEKREPDWRRWADSLDGRLWSPRPEEEAAAVARMTQLELRYADSLERYAFCQFLVHAQHQRLRERAGGWRLKLYGDLQIGLSPRDAWAWQGLFLSTYLMGAPPSRTNPDGQPWNYPVMDPGQYFEADDAGANAGSRNGPVLRFMNARMDKMLGEYDGLRLDHPHGLVCPWVYRADLPDALWSVQHGARLFSSPDLPDHPELAHFALVHAGQVDRAVSRYADRWVKDLTPEQVRRYSVLFDTVVEAARRNGRQVGDLLAEVLSTLPYPLERVLAQYGLGRFRVTQKADLDNPADVYRSENVGPDDWVMVGNHDTKSLWRLVADWQWKGTLRAQAEYLAWRLCPEPEDREAFARELSTRPGLLAQAKVADLFASRARNVMMFVTDLLGMPETYNTPGTVDERNWTLRVPPDWARQYRERLRGDAAVNLPAALAMALRAQDPRARSRHARLLEALDALARELRAG